MDISDIIRGLELIGSLSGSGSAASNMAGSLSTALQAIALLLIIPSLLNCFFGYKIQKVFITLGGLVVGGAIGVILGLLSGDETVAVVLTLLLAVLGGLLAFKLYLLGLFITFWLYGTVLFAVLFIFMGGFEMIPAATVLGLIVGVLAVVLHKGFVICATAICGGMPAGMALGALVGGPVVGVVLGVILSALGMFVQFRMEKKADPASAQNAAAAAANAGPAAPDGFTAPENSFQPLGTTVPATYCPRGGVLTEKYSLSKDGNENVFAAVSFRNVGDKPVIALYYTLLCRSVGGDELGSMERVLLDLNVAPSEAFSSGKPFQLADRTTRLIDVRLTQVVTAGGEAIRLTEEDNKPLPPLRELRGGLSAELLELAGVKADERYFLTELENGLWVCTCGNIAGAACPHCGRTRGGVLRDNGSDVRVRINDRIRAELSRAEDLKSKRELTELRDAISRDRELLQGQEDLKELAGDCDRALESLGERLSRIASREEKAKKKARRYALLGGAAAGCIAVLALAIVFLRGLPPSDSRVVKDLTADLTERCGNYRITKSEVEYLEGGSTKDWKWYRVELWGEDKKLRDELHASTYLTYEKKNGAFRLDDIGYYVPTIIPAEGPSSADTYTGLTVNIQGDGNLIVVSDSGGGWELLSDWADPSELSYSREMDYAGAEMSDNIARIPVSFHASYRNEEGGLDSDVHYIYMGSRVWESDGSQPQIALQPKLDVALTREALTGILKSESVSYGEDMFSCEHLTLVDEQITYTEGGQYAAVSSGFAWDDGQSSFDGAVTMELAYEAGRWNLTSLSYPQVSHPKPNAAMTQDQAEQLLREAIEAEGLITGEPVEMSVDSVRELDGFADLTAHYVVRDGEYLHSMTLEGGYEYHAGLGYQLEDRVHFSEETFRPEQDISASLSTPYRIDASGAAPVGIAGSGDAQAVVNINTYGTAGFTLNIGGLRVSLTGSISGPTPTYSCSSATQDIRVRYTFFTTLETEIPYTASGVLRYENGALSGTLVFDTVAVGVDSFSITLGN